MKEILFIFIIISIASILIAMAIGSQVIAEKYRQKDFEDDFDDMLQLFESDDD